jgi:hypothetical protein
VPDYFTVADRLYEVDAFGPVDQPGFHFECWDMSTEGGGLIGTIVVPAEDGPLSTTIELLRPVPLDVLLQWMAFVPEARALLASSPSGSSWQGDTGRSGPIAD